jgi:hypothetical protein
MMFPNRLSSPDFPDGFPGVANICSIFRFGVPIEGPNDFAIEWISGLICLRIVSFQRFFRSEEHGGQAFVQMVFPGRCREPALELLLQHSLMSARFVA